jgi:serine/threonine protein kinase
MAPRTIGEARLSHTRPALSVFPRSFMAARRDHNAEVPGSAGAGTARPAREPTESLALAADEWPGMEAAGADAAIAGSARSPASLPPPRPLVWKPRAQRPSASPVERPEDLVGAVLGSYRLLELIGRGGMGFVYRAEHTRLGREVALKLLRADYARRRDAVARFFQEARTVNRVRHRNIVDVTDFVELPDGTTFIIMELLRGENLGKWARAGFDQTRAVALLTEICDGLAAAHAVGVVHRDLKPDNVIVVTGAEGNEHIKLLDFGVAKLLNRDDEDVGLETAAGSVIGTPAYMSPEQAGGLTVDARSDIYSLGAIMYELFCAAPMFRGKSFGEYVRKHLTETPVRPSQTQGGAGIDERIEAMILRCLDKDPARRYQHIGELRDELLGLLGSIETHVGDRGRILALDAAARMSAGGRHAASGSSLIPLAPTAPSLLSAASRSTAPTTALTAPRRWPWITAAIAIAAAAAGAAFAVATSSDLPSPASAATPGLPASHAVVQSLPPGTAAGTPAHTVDVRIDATPAGDVYAAGSNTRLCTTPCAITVDPADGGDRERRTYTVRRAGFFDEPVIIDLDGPSQQVALMRARRRPPPTPAVEPDVLTETDGDELDAFEPEADDEPARERADRTRSRRDRDRADRTDKNAKGDKPDRTEKGDKADKVPEPEVATPPRPADPPPPRRRPGPVDPADTLDPFR